MPTDSPPLGPQNVTNCHAVRPFALVISHFVIVIAHFPERAAFSAAARQSVGFS